MEGAVAVGCAEPSLAYCTHVTIAAPTTAQAHNNTATQDERTICARLVQVVERGSAQGTRVRSGGAAATRSCLLLAAFEWWVGRREVGVEWNGVSGTERQCATHDESAERVLFVVSSQGATLSLSCLDSASGHLVVCVLVSSQSCGHFNSTLSESYQSSRAPPRFTHQSFTLDRQTDTPLRLPTLCYQQPTTSCPPPAFCPPTRLPTYQHSTSQYHSPSSHRSFHHDLQLTLLSLAHPPICWLPSSSPCVK